MFWIYRAGRDKAAHIWPSRTIHPQLFDKGMSTFSAARGATNGDDAAAALCSRSRPFAWRVLGMSCTPLIRQESILKQEFWMGKNGSQLQSFSTCLLMLISNRHLWTIIVLTGAWPLRIVSNNSSLMSTLPYCSLAGVLHKKAKNAGWIQLNSRTVTCQLAGKWHSHVLPTWNKRYWNKNQI